MASELGVAAFRGPRDPEKVRRELKAAGYNGEKVVVLVPVDSLAMKPLGDVAAGMLREVGMDVEYVGVDYGSC